MAIDDAAEVADVHGRASTVDAQHTHLRLLRTEDVVEEERSPEAALQRMHRRCLGKEQHHCLDRMPLLLHLHLRCYRHYQAAPHTHRQKEHRTHQVKVEAEELSRTVVVAVAWEAYRQTCQRPSSRRAAGRVIDQVYQQRHFDVHHHHRQEQHADSHD